MSETWSFVSHITDYLARDRFGDGSAPSLWPSEASAEITNEHGEQVVVGRCRRATFFRYLLDNYKFDSKYSFYQPLVEDIRLKSIPPDKYVLWLWKQGELYEEYCVQLAKEAGIFISAQTRVYVPDIKLSGKIDIVVINPETDLFSVIECISPDSLLLQADYTLVRADSLSIKKAVSHTGKATTVKNYQVKIAKQTTLYHLHNKVDGLQCRLTGNHPVQMANTKVTRYKNGPRQYSVIDTYWQKTKDIAIGDYLTIPKAKFSGNDTLIYSDVVHSWDYKVIDNKIYSTTSRSYQRAMPNEIEFNEDFAWLLGLYLAEGSTSSGTIYFSLHEDEVNIAQRIRTIVEQWGLTTSIGRLKQKDGTYSKGINVRISSRSFAELIRRIAPGTSNGRTKQFDYKLCPPDMVSHVLEGAYAGDGCICLNTVQHGLRKISTVVPNLAYLYFQLAAHAGWSPSLKLFQQGNTLFGSGSIYVISWSPSAYKNNSIQLIDGGDFWAYPVTAISTEEYSGNVYNMETSGEHSYVVGAIATHNCKSVYGFGGNAVLGTPADRRKGLLGIPRDSNLIQTALYDWRTRVWNNFEASRLTYGSRDTGRYAEYLVETRYNAETEEDDIFYAGIAPNHTSEQQAPYTIQNILSQFTFVQDSLDSGHLPNRDFELEYSEEKIAILYERGELNKADTARFEKRAQQIVDGKSKPIMPVEKGDWHCNLCKFKAVCYNEDKQVREL